MHSSTFINTDNHVCSLLKHYSCDSMLSSNWCWRVCPDCDFGMSHHILTPEIEARKRESFKWKNSTMETIYGQMEDTNPIWGQSSMKWSLKFLRTSLQPALDSSTQKSSGLFSTRGLVKKGQRTLGYKTEQGRFISTQNSVLFYPVVRSYSMG